jgi:carbohydrate kinase (thermoresistant glucokinase family)
MGVSGAGKTTLGRALAADLGWAFIEGDELHPPQNVAKMSAGIPLADADRWPFLENVAAAINAHAGRGVVASCSALKRSYRDYLRERCDHLCFVLPRLSRAALAERVADRPGHFMPASLLQSQLDTLEVPDATECAIVIDGEATTDAQVGATRAALAYMEEHAR